MELRSEMLAGAPGGAAEEALIEESRWGAVRALWERGVSKKAIARELGLDIKTVRKWCRQAWSPQKRRSQGRVLDSWEAFLRARAPEVGFNAMVLHRELAGPGYEGSYAALAKYIAPWRETWRGAELPTVRFETCPGEQAQVDWGTSWVYLGEDRVRVHLFTMVLGYSRRLFARAYRNEGLCSLLDGHAAAFAHFGGRTATILYDNPRTIVTDKDESTGRVVWNATFKDRMDFYGVEIKLCRYYRAQTKGKVESGVKYVKRNALAGRRFRDLEELNAWLLEWCLQVADERVHGTTHEKPSQRFLRETLLAVDLRQPSPRERVESRVVPRDSYVAVEANRYPVPLEWAGQTVEVRIQRSQVWITLAGVEPVCHTRLEGKHQVARWNGPPRRLPPRPASLSAAGPPRFDPAFLEDLGKVEIRSLGRYEHLLEQVQP
ncbi:MAG TPA: IS21 family transposase [Gemmatimonadales bacterium]|nr:IS21 family transposase [Gemmatimonadales bacterium]